MISSLGRWEGVLQGWARGPRAGHPVREEGVSLFWGRHLSFSEPHRHSPMLWGTPLIASSTKDLEHGENPVSILPPVPRAGIPEMGSREHVCWGAGRRQGLGRVSIPVLLTGGTRRCAGDTCQGSAGLHPGWFQCPFPQWAQFLMSVATDPSGWTCRTQKSVSERTAFRST